MDSSVINNIINIIALVLTVSPMVVTVVRYIGVKTNNRKVITIADRAAIIVSALDQVDMDKVLKKNTAIDKLLVFAQETKINLDRDQADDYIENAVRQIRTTAYGQEVSK